QRSRAATSTTSRLSHPVLSTSRAQIRAQIWLLRAWPSELRCRVGTGLTVNSLALPYGRMHNRQAPTSGSIRRSMPPVRPVHRNPYPQVSILIRVRHRCHGPAPSGQSVRKLPFGTGRARRLAPRRPGLGAATGPALATFRESLANAKKRDSAHAPRLVWDAYGANPSARRSYDRLASRSRP